MNRYPLALRLDGPVDPNRVTTWLNDLLAMQGPGQWLSV